MLRIFRNIRQKLLENGNLQKYFWYALGEILLVVIGILIALQINNWNEANKAKEFERTTLIELQKAVQNDIRFVDEHLIGNRNNRKREAHAYFDRILMGQSVDMDSLDRHFDRLTFTSQFQYNPGPYESIKSAGLERIKNDSLRSKITNLYDFHLPRTESLIEWAFDVQEKSVQENYPKLVNQPRVSIVEGEVEIYKSIRSIDFNTNPNFLELLDRSKFATEWVRNGYEEMSTMLHELDQMLEKELEGF
ncbi:MAG: DUF6090 family protein [bacterium]|nr:DUF6090 family protein [bacterium]